MRLIAVALALLTLSGGALAQQPRPWDEILREARGQIVYWNAWGGDDRNNAYIAWVAAEIEQRYGVSVRHVKLADTAEAVTRVVAERAAGRDTNGTIDLIWINGPNLASMKQHDLLFGPITPALPNFALVDKVGKPSTVVDFTLPVDGMASPWLMAQVVYVYDSARSDPASLPRSAAAMLAWAKAHPGRLTHPVASNFLGATFLKQALYELVPDPSVLQHEATDELFVPAAERLFAWYEELRPHLWRSGRDFPENGPAMRQLLADGEIDLMISFNPAEAALGIANGLLPETARVLTLAGGSIGNTSFVAIPYNASHKEGAMIVANFLLEPEAQARAQDPRVIGLLTVLDVARLPAAEQALFETTRQPGMPPPGALGQPLLEPHPSWATRLVAEWQKRTAR
ncbi:ABC transporter substrate-binding protein [Microvirga massiliensis]|uniref:ABC transporter substrate-binding protein n=1 Tax=Microvirga massiliensis TaxID=1033741 RepID=UPI00062B9CDF|nr:ABC transporter substrate-binding protein [Microvirga massiliensis]